MKQCLNCINSKRELGGTHCARKDKRTGVDIGVPNDCGTQRSSRFWGMVYGYDLCGKKAKYYKEG